MTTSYLKFCDEIAKSTSNFKAGVLKEITGVNLSTMTIHLKLLISHDINLSVLQNSFHGVTLSNGVTWDLFPSQTKNGEFFNQLTLGHTDHSKKKVKIFSNGTFHVTGVVNEAECMAECYQVAKILKGWGLIQEIKFSPLTVNLINTNYEFGFDINLPKVQRHIKNNKTFLQCHYDPQKYPGLNIKISIPGSSNVTILLFRSGNLMITGGKSYNDILFAYNEINSVIAENYNDVFMKWSETTEHKKKKSIANGYN